MKNIVPKQIPQHCNIESECESPIIYLISNPRFMMGQNNYIGGHIAHAIGLIEAFAKQNINIYIITSKDLPFKTQNPLIKQYLIPYSGIFSKIPIFNRFIWDLKCIFKLRKLIRKIKPISFYVRFSTRSLVIPVLKLFSKVNITLEVNTPAVITVAQKGLKIKFLAKFIDRLHYRSANNIILVSETLRKIMLEVYPKYSNKYLVVPNGVDPAQFAPTKSGTDIRKKYGIPQEAIVIGFSGKFENYHRIDLLIRAYNRLLVEKSIKDKVWLLLIGDGLIRKKLEFLAGELSLINVIFTEGISFGEMPSYLGAADILVSPLCVTNKGKSHLSPIKLYEYMAMGKAVVVSDIGQQKEVIENGRNGLIFKEDNEDDLVDKLYSLIINRELIEKLGKQARQDVIDYHTWSKRAEIINNCWNNNG